MKTKAKNKSTKKCGKFRTQKRQSCRRKQLEFEGKRLALQIRLTLQRHFPKLIDDLSCLEDYRKSPEYEVKELLMACISMFLDSLISLWECLFAFMMVGHIHQPVIDKLLLSNCQMRY